MARGEGNQSEFDALYIRMGAEVTTHEEEVLKWTQ